jgi:iron complex transport system substrate-binding protein
VNCSIGERWPNPFRKFNSVRLSILAIALGVSVTGLSVVQAEERLLTIGGAITETIYDLGLGSQVVAVDSSSLYPEAATKLPQVGYERTLSAEGVLGLRPSLILATSDAGPKEVTEQIRNAGVKFVSIQADPGVEGAKRKIQAIADAVGKSAAGKEMIAKIDAQMAALPPAKPIAQRPKILFIYARGGGTLNVSGTGTAAHAMIEAAGGRNAVTEYKNYQPLTAESAVRAAPDIILLTSRGLESIGGIDQLLKSPGLAETPAGRARRVVAMDDLKLLGFGPRTGEAVAELTAELQK